MAKDKKPISRQKKAAKPKGYRSKKHLENPGGKPSHRATQERRDLVTLYAVGGVPQDRIADIFGISSKTLRKYYRAELDTSLHQANAEICGKIFKQAKEGCRKSQALWIRKMTSEMARNINIYQANLDVTPEKPFATVEEGAKAYKELMDSLQGG